MLLLPKGILNIYLYLNIFMELFYGKRNIKIS